MGEFAENIDHSTPTIHDSENPVPVSRAHQNIDADKAEITKSQREIVKNAAIRQVNYVDRVAMHRREERKNTLKASNIFQNHINNKWNERLGIENKNEYQKLDELILANAALPENGSFDEHVENQNKLSKKAVELFKSEPAHVLRQQASPPLDVESFRELIHDRANLLYTQNQALHANVVFVKHLDVGVFEDIAYQVCNASKHSNCSLAEIPHFLAERVVPIIRAYSGPEWRIVDDQPSENMDENEEGLKTFLAFCDYFREIIKLNLIAPTKTEVVSMIEEREAQFHEKYGKPVSETLRQRLDALVDRAFAIDLPSLYLSNTHTAEQNP